MVEANAIWEEGGKDALKEHPEKIEREIICIPAPDRIGPNPETQAALDRIFDEAEEQVRQRDHLAQESANVWADTLEQGGEEEARKGLWY